MITVLSKIFIKNSDGLTKNQLLQSYGTLCCVVGIVLNAVLFALKYFAGVLSGSIAITADAFNNLSDAGSSVITLVGLKLAGKKPDPNHPFGHGRVEYLSGLAVSVIIVVVGVQLFLASVDEIKNPSDIDTSVISFVILIFSILVKGYMFYYNRQIGKKINSSGMKATAIDCLGDVAATFVVLVSTVIAYFTDFHADGYCGILVSLFIIYAGIVSARDTVSPLLGSPPEKEFVDSVEEIVMSYDKIIGIHDLVVHDYGPGRVMVSLHAEVDGKNDIFELHDVIDNAEHRLSKELGCIAVIHMDPIETDNENVTAAKETAERAVKQTDESITIHDFRIVPGKTHTNLIFDIVVPYTVKLSDDELKNTISRQIKNEKENYFAVINIDRPYV
ncbi:MAG: cation diffusion facilitator family transporter [Clostridiales bacterium]|nr:cation diffusion facilitator family transporter [Clostridiales bacterium]